MPCKAAPPTPPFQDRSRTSNREVQLSVAPVQTAGRLSSSCSPANISAQRRTHPGRRRRLRSGGSRTASALSGRQHGGGGRSAPPDSRQSARSRRRPAPPAEGGTPAASLSGSKSANEYKYRPPPLPCVFVWLKTDRNQEKGGELRTELQQVGGGEVAVREAEAPAVRLLAQLPQKEANSAPADLFLGLCGLASVWNTNEACGIILDSCPVFCCCSCCC